MAKILVNDLIYLHAPKTGGNWLTKILDEETLVKRDIEHKHANYDLVCGNLRSNRQRTNIVGRISRHVLPRRNYVFFTVVRNPLTWYESWFKYQKSKSFKTWGDSKTPYEWHANSPLNGIPDSEFNEFVTAIHDKCPGFVTQLFTSFAPHSGVVVLKNESIREDFIALCKSTDLPVREERIRASEAYGVSPKADTTWRREVLERTVALERAAFDRFGYQWDGVVSVAD